MTVNAKALSARKVEKVSLTDIPDGKYTGTWGGYVVEVRIEGVKYELEVDTGVRCMGMVCIVTVDNGSITIE